MTALQLALFGLGAGAIYVLLGQSLVLIHRGSGVLNFAQGGVAMIAAQVFYRSRDEGILPTPVALIVALGAAMGIGAAMHLVVLRRLADASDVARLISSLALLGLLQGIGTVLWNGSDLNTTQVVTSILPSSTIRLGANLTIGADKLILLGIALLLTVLLRHVYQRSRFGLATSAVAENERAAVALGWSPTVIGALNWVAGSALAGLAGILLSPIAGLSVTALVLTVIPGLAVALVGEFSSFRLVLAGGLLLGIAQSEAELYITTPGVADSAPFVIVIGLVVFRGRLIPARGDDTGRPVRAGSGGIRLRWLLPPVLVLCLLVHTVSNSWALAIASSALAGLIGLSMVLLTGYAGQISLAQTTIAGVGAVTAANLSARAGLPFVPAVLLGALAAGAVGVVVGLPALRCRGASLAVVTIGLSLVLEEVVLGNPWISGGDTANGTLTVGEPSLFGWRLGMFDHPVRFTVCAIAVFAAGAVAVANIRRGGTGRRLLASNANERAAAASGVNVVGVKLYAFAVASTIAGLSGALAAFEFPNLDLTRYTTVGSISALLGTVIGGVGYLYGAVVQALANPGGGVAQQVLSYFPGRWTESLGLIGAVAALLTLAFYPSGAADLHARQFAFIRRLLPLPGRRGVPGSAAVPVVPGPAAETAVPAELPVERVRSERVRGGHLSVRGLSVSFGGVHAVQGVDLDVAPGEVVGLIGPNGAGKTTILDAISGAVSAKGTVTLDGVPLAKLSPPRRAALGVGRTFQSVELFENMTAYENIRVGAESRGGCSYAADLVRPRESPLPPVAEAAILDLELSEVLARRPEELSTGTRRLVGIARTLAGAPRVLLLDEPGAGLNAAEKRELLGLVRHLADSWGLAVLLIEHDVRFVTAVSDRVLALALGRVVASGTPEQVMASPEVITSYLGETAPGMSSLADLADLPGRRESEHEDVGVGDLTVPQEEAAT